MGKSALIDEVLAEETVKTSWGGSQGTTDKLEIYESEAMPFNVIDTVGLESQFFQKNETVDLVNKWSEEGMRGEDVNSQINVIWFCVDGTLSKWFPKTIQNMLKAMAVWENVPIIVVITKYSSVLGERRNIKMVKNVFAKPKNHPKNLRGIISVAMETRRRKDTVYVSLDGVAELLNATNKLMPEEIEDAERDIARFLMPDRRKKGIWCD